MNSIRTTNATTTTTTISTTPAPLTRTSSSRFSQRMKKWFGSKKSSKQNTTTSSNQQTLPTQTPTTTTVRTVQISTATTTTPTVATTTTPTAISVEPSPLPPPYEPYSQNIPLCAPPPYSTLPFDPNSSNIQSAPLLEPVVPTAPPLSLEPIVPTAPPLSLEPSMPRPSSVRPIPRTPQPIQKPTSQPIQKPTPHPNIHIPLTELNLYTETGAESDEEVAGGAAPRIRAPQKPNLGDDPLKGSRKYTQHVPKPNIPDIIYTPSFDLSDLKERANACMVMPYRTDPSIQTYFRSNRLDGGNDDHCSLSDEWCIHPSKHSHIVQHELPHLQHNNTNCLEEGMVKNTRRTGTWYTWTPEGHCLATTEYKSGKKHGMQKTFHPDGSLRSTQQFTEGNVVQKAKLYPAT